MKNMFVLLLLLIKLSYGQTYVSPLNDNGIYITAKDFQSGILTHAFNKSKHIKFVENKRLLIVVKDMDSSYLFYYDQIWGYRKDGVDWRLFNGSDYRVVRTKKICIYSTPVCVACLTTAPLNFSIDLTSPIHPLSKHNLKDAYHTNTAFVEKIKKLPWTTSIMKRDKHSGEYQFIKWL
ncbi:MAG: hypothetical protein V4539_16845 [Bacteroidota bacterium]